MELENVGRRAFVITSLSAGFALAVRPVHAEAIKTDEKGLVAGEVKIGQMPAYRAMPEGTGKFPMVLVVQEVFGVHEHIKDLCRRLAKAGYIAVAPALYAREGDTSKMTDFGDIMKVVSKVPDDQVVKDLDATVDWAKAQGKVDGDRVAIVGFCWGGRQVWMYGASARAPKAGAAFYGPISNAPTALQPKNPIDISGKLKTPTIGFYGAKDGHIPVAHVEQMKKDLGSSKVSATIEIYPNADHGFNADYRPSYNKDAAEDAWKKMLEWFKKNGV